MIICCRDTATTEIYTYRHTLSLHDALPICGGCRRSSAASSSVSTRSPGSIIFDSALSIVVLPEPVPPEMTMLKRLAPAIFSAVHIFRSEEHTSELQSLMRISYAVFCLKKKTKHNHTSDPYTPHSHINNIIYPTNYYHTQLNNTT